MTFHADFRLLAAIRVSMEGVAEGYLAQRERLKERAWQAVDICSQHALYCDVLTFPGWQDHSKMLDFGWMHQKYSVSGYDTFCFRLAGSPIADSIELTAEQIYGNERLDIESLRQNIPLQGLREEYHGNAHALLDAHRLRSAFQRSSFARCLSTLCGQAFVESAFLLYTENWSADDVLNANVEDAVALCWLTALLYPESEIAIRIDHRQ